MTIVHTTEEWRDLRRSAVFEGKTVGFVPTMGALHAGHVALLERARAENDLVVLSIFVNPTQFNDPRDLEKYPRTWEADLAAARRAGVDAIFAPVRDQMYPDGYRYRVTEDTLSALMEGRHRPGHFDGVLTVVLKLLLLVQADRAYFGEKDMQQLLLVRGMAQAFFVPTEIVACPTVRAEDGLALSSRNALLTPEGRARAPEFARILREESDPEKAKRRLEAAGFGVDYVEHYEQWRLGAVRIDGIRLIDNVRSENPL
ncbi:MAG: pantoate--beta-alanine ligase [Opitutaceae bacterium]|nr:pantoate--beta-alanine ligase [Opitutaceae bacterium]